MSKKNKIPLDDLAEHLAAYVIINAPSGLLLEGLFSDLSRSKMLAHLASDEDVFRSCLDVSVIKGLLVKTETANGVFLAPAEDAAEDEYIDDDEDNEHTEDDTEDYSSDKSFSTRGVLRITPNGYGFVTRRVGEDILVPQAAVGRAISGDLVQIDVFREDGFESTGEVTNILSPTDGDFVGILSAPEKNQMHRLLPFTFPLCGRGILVPSTHGDGLAGSLARVSIEKRPDRPGRPIIGRVVDYCPDPTAPEQAGKAICVEFGLHTHLPDNVKDEAQRISAAYNCKENGTHSRRDLTHLPFITIDGESSRDFDDAVYLEETNSGWNIKVAIADVSYFVTPGSALDDHAYERGTSVYFPDECIPMLPEELSNGICSLVEGEVRLVLAADMVVTPDGEISGYEFYRASICSRKRLTYQQAEHLISKPVESEIASMLCKMNDCRIALNRKRIEDGALIFQVEEINLEEEDSSVYRKTAVAARMQSQMLIEELMLAANKSAARFISGNLSEQTVLLRTHDEPDEGAIRDLAKYANVSHIGKSSRQILQEITDMPRSYANGIFINKALRCMKKAGYSAVDGGLGQLHFSLATEYYTHFTSPIRRYPDILVHRAITGILDNAADGRKDLVECARHCSQKELQASKAERAYIKRVAARSIAPLIGEQSLGVVSGMSKKGIYVEIGGVKIEGIVASKNLKGRFDKTTCSYHLYQTNGFKITPRTIRLGTQVTVVISSVDEMHRAISLRFL